MSDTSPISIRLAFHPYDPDRVRGLLTDVRNEFGLPGRDKGRRWHFWVPSETSSVDPTGWEIWFTFADKNDALMFALKYQAR